MTRILAWIRTLHGVVSNYARDQQRTVRRIDDLENVLRERTDIHVDIGYSKRRVGANVIVVGRYRNCDYVQTYALSADDFAAVINQLKQMERYGTVRTFDAPLGVSAVFEAERQQ